MDRTGQGPAMVYRLKGQSRLVFRAWHEVVCLPHRSSGFTETKRALYFPAFRIVP
jgi:hypothetical protein